MKNFLKIWLLTSIVALILFATLIMVTGNNASDGHSNYYEQQLQHEQVMRDAVKRELATMEAQ